MVTLVIMDGLGWTEKQHGNAVFASGTPYLKKLKEMFPHTLLKTHGESVGLEEGQMGGSEVGHLNIGAGRVVYQDLSKINNMIKANTLKDAQEVVNAFNHAKKFGSTLHFMGLLSDGGIHSKISHLEYLVQAAIDAGVKKIVVHAFTDGRDTLKDSGLKFALDFQKKFEGKTRIASLCGRIYAMDREKRYDRLQKAYDMLVMGRAENYTDNLKDAFTQSYEKGIYDEFIEPVIIGKPEKIMSNDACIFFNYRSDRARELSQSIAEQAIKEMSLVNLKNVYFVGMTEYNADFKNVKAIIGPEKVTENLAKILSENGKKQYHISETTKYAHVTFFLNGGIETPYKGEDRKLIESYDVKDFSETPQMRAFEITEDVISKIAENKYDFIIVNLSNADMVGHTGNFDATVESVNIVDKCAYLIALATLSAGGQCLVTADHGNADFMLDDDNNVITSHSINLVPFILAGMDFENVSLKEGKSLTSIAPTILKLLNIEIPAFMDEPLF